MADLMTTTQVQGLLHIDRTTIYRMVESGRLPAIRIGKQWRFSRDEIGRWLLLQGSASAPVMLLDGTSAAPSSSISPSPKSTTTNSELCDLLPQPCSQLIQDAFADILGVMMVITDMQGQPVTRISNPCGFYATVIRDPEDLGRCVETWQQLATDPAIEPRFFPNEMGLLCARGLVRLGSDLKGMVVIGGIAPEVWPPAPEQLACLAETFGLNPADIAVNADAVYRLDRAAQEKALRSVQRIADIYSHIVEDRNLLCGRLQAIASLTAL